MRLIYAGSFDPITNGHLWMIREGAKIADDLIVAIGDNPAKKYKFSIQERKAMIDDAVRDIPNVKVTAFIGDFLVNYAKIIGADTILRGIRNETDYEFERGMRYVNADIDSSIKTIFLIPPRDLVEVSSSMVKGLVGPIGWQKVIKPYVPQTVHSAIVMGDLKGKFYAAWSIDEARDLVFNEIVSRYSEPHRHYHTLQHISDCLDELMHFSYSPEAEKLLVPFNITCLALAIWFHDLVYDTKASDNEEQSANRFQELVTGTHKQGTHLEIIEHTKQLILATKTHEGDHPLTQLMLDIDLSILGKKSEEFKEYDANIRKEYSWVLGPLYSMNRKKIMRKFYEKERLFHTDFFHEKYEKQAKENLKIFA